MIFNVSFLTCTSSRTFGKFFLLFSGKSLWFNWLYVPNLFLTDLKFNQEEIPKCFEALKQNAENQTNEENDGTTEACIKNQENGQIDAKLDQELPENISELIFSRLTEYKVMHEVSKHGLCKPVYARYNNGIAYGYTQGAIVNSSLMLTNDFLNEIAIKLGKFLFLKTILI